MRHPSSPIAQTRRGLGFVKIFAAIAVIAILIVLLRPMIEAGRDDFYRPENSTDKMKAIALALLKYEGKHKTFPAAYTTDKNGTPRLSWRVLVLPYLGEDALYKDFHLDEPWDSEHNKRLISKMPKTYASPSSKVGEGRTNYLTVRGPETVFSGNTGVSLENIQDGCANTIMAVEVSDERAIVWTRPDDFQYDEQDPMKGLVGLHPGLFVAGFADGHVQLIPETINPKTLKALFTRSGGENVHSNGSDW
jgi:prepilin-type processing-associated H-X9-DG protein